VFTLGSYGSSSSAGLLSISLYGETALHNTPASQKAEVHLVLGNLRKIIDTSRMDRSSSAIQAGIRFSISSFSARPSEYFGVGLP
jgi:hypothetical protein